MAYIDGDDFVDGAIFSYEEANRIKNNWRGAAAPANIQSGMLFSDEDDDKLYHCTGASGALEEVLQATLSSDVSPVFDNLFLDFETAALSDPPTAAELAAVFGSDPGDGFIGYVQGTDSAAKMYHVVFYGGTFYYQEMTAAV
jgi:hypothetical protein